MPAPSPFTLIAELSYQCPLHCPYCSNPLDIGADSYRHHELKTEDWIRTFRQARGLGVLQLALTGGEPMLRSDLAELCAAARESGLYSSLITAGTLFTRERATIAATSVGTHTCARRMNARRAVLFSGFCSFF